MVCVKLPIKVSKNAVDNITIGDNGSGEKGISANLGDLFRDISARDERDSAREVSPLEPAGDAVVIDTDDLDVEGAQARAAEIVARALRGR